MSQAGFTPIQLYFSTTAAATPSAGNLANGELAINITDGKLFYKDNGGVVKLLASNAGSAGDVVGPASATDNALARFDTTTGKLIQNSVGILSDAGVLTGLTGLTSSGNVTLSALTSGRVPYASTGGLLVDSANLTFDGTTLTANALTVTNATTITGGTANGVAYLNGSKVLTTGSLLSYNGTNRLTLSTNTASSAEFAISAVITGNTGISNQIIFQDTGTNKWSLGGSNIGLAAQNSFGIYNYGPGLVALTIDSATNNWNIPTGSFTVEKNAVFNESGGDFDFRVESDNNTHMLFVDAGLDRIGINDSTPSYQMDFGGGTTVSRRIQLQRGSDDTSQNMLLGWNGIDMTRTSVPISVAQTNFTINQVASDATRNTFTINSDGGATFNEDGYDSDFRVESDAQTHMLFVDGGANTVSINSSTNFANSKLFVEGNITANYSDTIALRYNVSGQTNNYYKGMTGTDLNAASARGLHLFNFDQDSDEGVNIWNGYPSSPGRRLLAKFGLDLIVFNDASNDVDFRVESDTNTHALFVDAALGTVCINGAGATSNTDVAGFQNLSGNGVLSGGGGFPFVALSRTQNEATANNATTDAFRFLDHNSAVFGTSALAGKFYINATGASGANQFNAIYNVLVCGDGVGTGSSVFALETSITRGTSPVASIALVNDGGGGAVKVQITYINNSGVVTGGTSRITFIGQTSTT
jgi:hypothetical protein